jgi:cell division protein FtsB
MKPRKRTTYLIIFIIVFLSIAGYVFFFGKQGIAHLYLRQKKDAAAIVAARWTIDSLRLEITRLKSDTAYIERIAREKLGMARQNEKVYKFVEKGK